MRYIPVVDSKKSMNLICQVRAEELKEYCKLYYPNLKEEQSNSDTGTA